MTNLNQNSYDSVSFQAENLLFIFHFECSHLCSGVCLGLWRLPGLWFVWSYSTAAQTDRRAGYDPSSGHFHWGQSLPGPVSWCSSLLPLTWCCSQHIRLMCVLVFWSLNLIQTMKCTHGATTPWVSVDKETPQDPSPNPRRWLAWTELLFSKSQRGHPTALPGLLCPETGDLEDFTVPLNSEPSVPNSKTYRCLQGCSCLSLKELDKNSLRTTHLMQM